MSRPGSAWVRLAALALFSGGLAGACLDSPLAQRCDSDRDCPDFSFCDPSRSYCVAYGEELGRCGDAVIDFNVGEQCDDGNRDDYDGCSAMCQLEILYTCGDGVVDYAEGEQCDDGMQCDNGNPCLRNSHCAGIGLNLCQQRDRDGCSATCQIEAPETCGDGLLDRALGERCDDGSACEDGSACAAAADCAGIGRGSCAPRSGDGCSAACRVEPALDCGDGELQAGEVCDEGAARNGDVCSTDTSLCSCDPACDCNMTCDLGATTELVAGELGVAGLEDGAGIGQALIGNNGGRLAIADGKLFFSDADHYSIRTIDLGSGEVNTVAGDSANGSSGYQDDADSGLGARFYFSSGAITTDGVTLWIADSANHVIRAMEVAPPHGVTTVSGHRYQSTDECLYQDPEGYSCYQDSDDPNEVEFQSMADLEYYNGYVYILDGNLFTLRRLDPATGAVRTVVGAPGEGGGADGYGPDARLSYPRNLASDGSQLIYISESGALRSYHTATQAVSTPFDHSGFIDGPAGEARIGSTSDMVAHGLSIYWIESSYNAIRQLRLDTGEVRTHVGGLYGSSCYDYGDYVEGTGNQARFNCASALEIDPASATMYVFDERNFVIRLVR